MQFLQAIFQKRLRLLIKLTKVQKVMPRALYGKAYVFMTYSLSGGANGGAQAESAVTASVSSPYWTKAADSLSKM